MIAKTIETMSGVTSEDQGPGSITVTLFDDSNIIEMTVNSLTGPPVVVYLNHRQTVGLVMHLANVASQL